MKIYYLLFLFFCVYGQSICQTQLPSEPLAASGWITSIFGNGNHSDISLIPETRNLQYEQIDGSPYINNSTGANENIPIGKFYDASNEYLETALARYNAYTDNIEVSLLNDGVDYYYLNKKPNFFYITLGKTKYRAYEFNNNVEFFVIVSENDLGECSLLKKQKVIFLNEEKPSNSFVSGTPSRFRRVKDLFYFKINSSIIEVPKNKKHFHNLFGEKSNEMKQYLKSSKLKLTKEKDLLKISKFYNSLFE